MVDFITTGIELSKANIKFLLSYWWVFLGLLGLSYLIPSIIFSLLDDNKNENNDK